MENVSDIGTLSGYINEYGPLIVTLAIFMLAFVLLIVYVLNVNKKMYETMQATSNQLLTTFLDEHSSKKELPREKKHYDERNIVDLFVKLDKTLKNACDSTMKKTKSDRTAVYVFHNGSHASHGLPFFKMSCIAEKSNKGSNANIIMQDHQSMPLSYFESIVTSLYYNGEYRIIVNEDMDFNDQFFLQKTKIKDCFFVPIYDYSDTIMGFVFNGYNELDPNRDFAKEKEALTELAMVSKPVLEFSDVQEQATHNHAEEG